MAKDLDSSLQTESLILRVTANDVYWSLRTGQTNPAVFALQRATRTLWRVEGNEAREATAPFRACQIPLVELGENPWKRADELGRREWRIELRPANR